MSKNLSQDGYLAEEYYQIGEEVFASFPKFHPPLSYYAYDEKRFGIYCICHKGKRINKEQFENVSQQCLRGRLFVSRADHSMYVAHLAKQADLVLMDKNLEQAEVVKVIVEALSMRIGNFLNQPVLSSCDFLVHDIMVFSEYVWKNPSAIDEFMSNLYCGPYSLCKHTVNSMIIGAWLYINTDPSYNYSSLERIVQGLAIHDVGMTHVPGYICNKETPLNKDEVKKLLGHVSTGVRMLHKMGLLYDETSLCVREHHERLNGQGYPERIAGNSISHIGRIAAIADSLSGMIQKRVYAAPIKMKRAVEILHADYKKYDASICQKLLDAYASKRLALPVHLEVRQKLSEENENLFN